MDYEMGNTVDLKEREPAKAIQTADPRKKQEDAKRCIDIYVAAFQVLDAIPDSAQSYRWDLRLEFETDAGRKGVQYHLNDNKVRLKKYNTNDPVADSCVGVALLDSWRGDWVATETDPLKTICDKKEWLKPPPGEAWSSFEWAFKMLSWMWEEKMIWKNCEPFTDEENSWGPYDARMPLMAKLASWKLRVESGERLMEEELAVDRMTPDGMDRQYSHKWKGV